MEGALRGRQGAARERHRASTAARRGCTSSRCATTRRDRARVLAAFLAEVQPRAVLVEGPDDADALVDALVDAETRPPVAILGYRTDGTPGSSLWPFAALLARVRRARSGPRRTGPRSRFIDVPIARALARERRRRRRPRATIDGEERTRADGRERARARDECDLRARRRPHACARARGFRSFEEFWEASFEAPGYDAASFRAALLALRRARARAPTASVDSTARATRSWRARIPEHVARAFAPEADRRRRRRRARRRLRGGRRRLSPRERLPAPVPSAATLIPFSFPRLAEQLGYGAGNRAPQYYQRAHDAGCSFTRATLEVLVEFTEHLRLRGFMASLADTIEAYRLAVTLARSARQGRARPRRGARGDHRHAVPRRRDARRRLPVAERRRQARRPRRRARRQELAPGGVLARGRRARPAAPPTRSSRSRSS